MFSFAHGARRVTSTQARPATRLRRWRRFAIAATVLVAVLVPVTAAHAQWYMSKRAAERTARHYVSHYYANTYASDLTTACRRRGSTTTAATTTTAGSAIGMTAATTRRARC
jgi:hypothetical protein